MKKNLLLAGVMLLFVAGVVLVGSFKDDLSTQVVSESNGGGDGKELTPEQIDINKKTSSFVSSTAKNKEAIGIINAIVDPTKSTLRKLEVEASVVDLDEAKNVDFSEKSVKVPMKTETFTVLVGEETVLKGLEDKNELEPGMTVKIVSEESIYKTNEFAAVELELMSK